MMKQRSAVVPAETGFALVYMAAMLTVLLLFTGLAVDTGRAYVVKAQLTKAVDGAALAAARSLNSGNPRERSDRRSSRRTFRPGSWGRRRRPIRRPTPSFFALDA